MKFGLRYINTGRYTDPPQAIELVQAGEEAGFESAWTVDHVVVPEGYQSAYPYAEDGRMAGGVNDIPLPDPLIFMSFLASATSRIRLATGILILPQRNPVVTAKQVATLDHLSGGRILLGIGVGWLAEEFNAIGTPFADRGRRTDEYVAAMRQLWSSESPTFDGEFVRFKNAHCRPRPVNGSVPVIVGGHSKAAARRAGRLGDGFFPARGASAALFDLVRQSAVESGRNPDDIEFTASLPEDLEQIPEMAKLGVSRLLVPVTPMMGLNNTIGNVDDIPRWRNILDKYADA